MSRFATPNRSRPTVVARAPSIPIQDEPGHRYARGFHLPGFSFKGRHVIEVRVDGVRMQSPSISRPATPERGMSPAASFRDTANHSVMSLADSSHLPLSSTKPYIKPQRKDRNYYRANPLSESVQAGTGLTSQNISRRSLSPSPRLSREFSVNSEVISLSRPQSAQSVRSQRSSASSVSSITNTAYGWGARSNSNRSVSSPVAYNVGRGSSLNDPEAHIHQSLSVKPGGSPHAANKLQLTHSAYKSYRKAAVRDAIHSFLQSEDDLRHGRARADSSDLSQSPTQPPYQPPPSQQKPIQFKQLMDIDGENNDQLDENDVAIGRGDRKKYQRLTKMIESLRQSIKDTLENGGNPQQLLAHEVFFHSQFMHSVVVAQLRSALLEVIQQWQGAYRQVAISALDRYVYTWMNARRSRLVAQRGYQQALAQAQQLQREKLQLQHQVAQLRLQAESLGLTFPKQWLGVNIGGGGMSATSESMPSISMGGTSAATAGDMIVINSSPNSTNSFRKQYQPQPGMDNVTSFRSPLPSPNNNNGGSSNYQQLQRSSSGSTNYNPTVNTTATTTASYSIPVDKNVSSTSAISPMSTLASSDGVVAGLSPPPPPPPPAESPSSQGSNRMTVNMDVIRALSSPTNKPKQRLSEEHNPDLHLLVHSPFHGQSANSLIRHDYSYSYDGNENNGQRQQQQQQPLQQPPNLGSSPPNSNMLGSSPMSTLTHKSSSGFFPQQQQQGQAAGIRDQKLRAKYQDIFSR